MNKLVLYVIVLTVICGNIGAQPNCEVFKMENNTTKYKACKKCEESKWHYQFSKEYQEIMDEAISIDSTFDYPYRQKSIAYLKSGDFITWKKLIGSSSFIMGFQI